MPVTVYPAAHGAKAWRPEGPPVLSAEEMLRGACSKASKDYKTMISSSFKDFSSETPTIASRNGFARATLLAYNLHHRLTIRPEDIWFTILTQLATYVNTHAKQMRPYFVMHDSRKELKVEQEVHHRSKADIEALTRNMGDFIAENVRNPELRDWIMPDFTTTTQEDTVTAIVLMMGAMQKYYEYAYECSSCGIPSVTLLGIRRDWEIILERLDKLSQLGRQPDQFSKLLKPVLRRFIGTFDDPDSLEIKDFWQRVAHEEHGGSGPPYLSGWITAFCFWGQDGTSMYRPDYSLEYEALVLDNVKFHEVDLDRVPSMHISMPVMVINDFGEYPSTMVAGSVGYRVSSSGKAVDITTDIRDHSERWTNMPRRQANASRVVANADQSSTSSTKSNGRMTKLWRKLRKGKTQKQESPMKSMDSTDSTDTMDTVDTEGNGEPEEGSALDTLQPVSGWWLFENKDGLKALNGEDAPKVPDEPDEQDTGIAVDEDSEGMTEDENFRLDVQAIDRFLLSTEA